MTIEIVFNESFQNVETALHGALADCGYSVRPSPMAPGVEVKAKMAFWLGEKGNKLLSTFLPFIFKTNSVAAVLAAYQDGTVALTLRPNSAFGGNLAGGIAGMAGNAVGGFGVAGAAANLTAGTATSAAAGAADEKRKGAALTKDLGEIDVKLRERLAGRVAYEGPVRADVQQVPA